MLWLTRNSGVAAGVRVIGVVTLGRSEFDLDYHYHPVSGPPDHGYGPSPDLG